MAVAGASVSAGGWFAVRIDDDFARPGQAQVYRDVSSLMHAWGDASLVLVGMPIGLPDARHPTRRSFSEARARLKPLRHNSVSPVPSRAVIEAYRSGRASGYEAQSELNHRVLGKKLSKQSAAMIPRIAELDALLLSNRDARAKTRESHRELCFWGLNGGRPMTHAKRRPEGLAERLAVLCRYLPWAEAFYDDVRGKMGRGVPLAVVLDALATALTAVPDHPSLGDLHSVPTEPQRDVRGLPMEMVYRLPRSPAEPGPEPLPHSGESPAARE